MKENSLWSEKYRPDILENYVGNENLKSTISKYIALNDIQNLIFYGPPGCGKTTLAKIIVKNIDCDYWEKEYENSIYQKKIPIPTLQSNLIILLERYEVLELLILLTDFIYDGSII